MKADSRKFLNDNLQRYEFLEKAECLSSIDGSVLERLRDVMREFRGADYNTDLWCGHCAYRLVKEVYEEYFNLVLSEHGGVFDTKWKSDFIKTKIQL